MNIIEFYHKIPELFGGNLETGVVDSEVIIDSHKVILNNLSNILSTIDSAIDLDRKSKSMKSQVSEVFVNLSYPLKSKKSINEYSDVLNTYKDIFKLYNRSQNNVMGVLSKLPKHFTIDHLSLRELSTILVVYITQVGAFYVLDVIDLVLSDLTESKMEVGKKQEVLKDYSSFTNGLILVEMILTTKRIPKGILAKTYLDNVVLYNNRYKELNILDNGLKNTIPVNNIYPIFLFRKLIADIDKWRIDRLENKKKKLGLLMTSFKIKNQGGTNPKVTEVIENYQKQLIDLELKIKALENK